MAYLHELLGALHIPSLDHSGQLSAEWLSESKASSEPWSRNSSHIKPADNAGNTGWCERDPLDQGEMARVRWRSKTKLRSLGNGDGVGWAESALLACTGFYGMHFNS